MHRGARAALGAPVFTSPRAGRGEGGIKKGSGCENRTDGFGFFSPCPGRCEVGERHSYCAPKRSSDLLRII